MPRHRMKTTWFDRLLGIADDWQRPWAIVDPDPADDGAGGGGSAEPDEDDDEDDEDGAPLGQTGVRTLRKERGRRKALERQMAQMEQQLEALKGINPEAYKQAQEAAERFRREKEDLERATASERQRIEAKANEQLQKARQEAQAERERRISLHVRTLARDAFQAADGRPEADERGNSFFEGWMQLQGQRHLRVDEAAGRLYVVDADGDRIKTADGQDMDPVAWINEQADGSPVIGTFFRPKGGEGSGGFQGARGVRGVRGLSVEDARRMNAGQFLDQHYGSGR
jgi:hypothetical protein